MNEPLLATGEVRHSRLRPLPRAFTYSTFFLLLPMRQLHATPARDKALAHNRPALLAFHDRDHGDGRANAVEWLDEVLAKAGIDDARGEAWLQCFPRVLGYVFKPVSFWYCERADGSLRAIVAEVNNTFGERHCYVLDQPAWGRELTATKAFHVSPFCTVEGSYRFRFLRTSGSIVARVDHDDAQGPLLRTSVNGKLRPATRAALRRALWSFPFLTLGIAFRIHWQAFLLWRAHVPFHPHKATRKHHAPGVTR